MTTKASDSSSDYHGVLLQLIQLASKDSFCGISVAITAPDHGNGVTYVTRTLSAALKLMSLPDVMTIKLSTLENAQSAKQAYSMAMGTSSGDVDGDLRSPDGRGAALTPWNHSLESRKRLLQELGTSSRIILVDCPPLRQDSRTLVAASAVTSVILVVQAGVTTKDEILLSERKIQASGGNLEGFILNKVRSKTRWISRDT